MAQSVRIQANGPGGEADAPVGGGGGCGGTAVSPTEESYAALMFPLHGVGHKEQDFYDMDLLSSLLPSPVSSPQLRSYKEIFSDSSIFSDMNKPHPDYDCAVFLHGPVPSVPELDSRLRGLVQGSAHSRHGYAGRKVIQRKGGGGLYSSSENPSPLRDTPGVARRGTGPCGQTGMYGTTGLGVSPSPTSYKGEAKSLAFGPRPEPGSNADLLERLDVMRQGVPEVLNCNDNESIVKKMVFYEEQERVKKLVRRALMLSKRKDSAALHDQRARGVASDRAKAMDRMLLDLVEQGDFSLLLKSLVRSQKHMEAEEAAEDAEDEANKDGETTREPRLASELLDTMEEVCARISSLMDHQLDGKAMTRPLMPCELEMRNFAIASRYRTSMLQLKLLEIPEPAASGGETAAKPSHATAPLDRNALSPKKSSRGSLGKRQVPYGGLGQSACVILTRWFHANFEHPYPDDDDKEKLARASGLSVKQVSNWFINQRVRKWKPELQKIRDEARARTRGDR